MKETSLNTEDNVVEYKNSVKYIVIFLLFISWFLGQTDRMIMNFAAVYVSKEFILNASQIGFMLSAFYLGYLIMQIPGGYFSDRFGPRKVLLCIITVWSLFTAATALAWSYNSMLFFRICFGLAEGSFFASCTKAISLTVPEKERGRAISLVLVSSGIVAVVAPLISVKMILLYGWRAMFVIIGLVGLVVTGLYYWLFNVDDMAKRDSGRNTSTSTKSKSFGLYKIVMKIPFMWSVFFANFTAYTVIYGLMSWMPSYLVNAKHISFASVGWLQAVPGVGSLLGVLCSGFIIDRLSKQANKFTAVITSVIMAVLVYMMFVSVDVYNIIAYQTIVQLICGYIIIYFTSLVLKIVPTKIIGSATGFMNFGAIAGSFFAPFLMGVLVDLRGGAIGESFWYLLAAAVGLSISLITFTTKDINIDHSESETAA